MKYLLDTRVSFKHGTATLNQTNDQTHLMIFSKFFHHEPLANKLQSFLHPALYYFSYYHPLPNNGYKEVNGFFTTSQGKVKIRKIKGHIKPSALQSSFMSLPTNKRKLHPIEIHPLKTVVKNLINSINKLPTLLRKIDEQIYDHQIEEIDTKIAKFYQRKNTIELSKEIFFPNQEEQQSLFLEFKYINQQQELWFSYREALNNHKEISLSGKINNLKPLQISNMSSLQTSLLNGNQSTSVNKTYLNDDYLKIASLLQSISLQKYFEYFASEFAEENLSNSYQQLQLQQERNLLSQKRSQHLRQLETVKV